MSKVYIRLPKGGLGNKLFSIGHGEILRLKGYDVYYVRGAETHGWTYEFLQDTLLTKVPIVQKCPTLPNDGYGEVFDKKVNGDVIVRENLLICTNRLNQTPEVRRICQDLLSIDVVSKKTIETIYHTTDWNDAVAVHVRRGDYIGRNDVYNLLDETDYYQRAILRVGVDHKFIIISDDIEYCKKSPLFVSLPNVVYHSSVGSVQESGLLDLWLISKCKYNILANSTFAFWGGYLNRNSNADIIVPDKWTRKLRDNWRPGIIDGWCALQFEKKGSKNYIDSVVEHIDSEPRSIPIMCWLPSYYDYGKT